VTHAPLLGLPDARGLLAHILADFRGRRVVLYFYYPRDNTPGCAAQSPKSRRQTTAGTESKKLLWEKNLWELFDRPIAIDPDGRIEEVYRKVKPESHAAEILADLPDKGPE
jgi:peroxiredoxin Q/BCP